MLLVNTVALLSLGNLYARNQRYFNFAVNAGILEQVLSWLYL